MKCLDCGGEGGFAYQVWSGDWTTEPCPTCKGTGCVGGPFGSADQAIVESNSYSEKSCK